MSGHDHRRVGRRARAPHYHASPGVCAAAATASGEITLPRGVQGSVGWCSVGQSSGNPLLILMLPLAYSQPPCYFSYCYCCLHYYRLVGYLTTLTITITIIISVADWSCGVRVFRVSGQRHRNAQLLDLRQRRSSKPNQPQTNQPNENNNTLSFTLIAQLLDLRQRRSSKPNQPPTTIATPHLFDYVVTHHPFLVTQLLPPPLSLALSPVLWSLSDTTLHTP